MRSETIPIIYEDSEIFVINKRQGLPVQGGAGISHSVDSDLAAQVGQKIYLVHRLDKETSGLLVCAKNPAAAAKWTRLVGDKTVEKEYKALCFGAMKSPRGRMCSDIAERGMKKRAETFYETESVFAIPWEGVGVLSEIATETRAEIRRNENPRGDSFENRGKKMCGNPFGNCGDEMNGNSEEILRKGNRDRNFTEKNWGNSFENRDKKMNGNPFGNCSGKPRGIPVEENSMNSFGGLQNSCDSRAKSQSFGCDIPREISLLRLRLGTGRTHQLRIHLAGEGVPICGDDKYGDFAANRLLKKQFGIKRLCLCAFRLTLPLSGGRRTFEIEADFVRLSEALRAER